jgi:hypothetical protein
MTIGGAATRNRTAYQLLAACIPLSGYVRVSLRLASGFTDGFPACAQGLLQNRTFEF